MTDADDSDYTQIFSDRGPAYDRAMRRFPEARREEFRAVVARADPSPGHRVADVPAGGGYLAEFLPQGCHYRSHEPSSGFAGDGAAGIDGGGFLPLPWEDASVDRVCSLAGVHHLADKEELLREMGRVTCAGGRLVLADVEAGSAVARFLDDFVGRFNSTGHEGLFLDGALVGQAERAGWAVCRLESVAYHWRFGDRRLLGRFCRTLFDLRGLTDEAVAEAASEWLGVDDLGPEVGLRWGLLFLTAERSPEPW